MDRMDEHAERQDEGEEVGIVLFYLGDELIAIQFPDDVDQAGIVTFLFQTGGEDGDAKMEQAGPFTLHGGGGYFIAIR